MRLSSIVQVAKFLIYMFLMSLMGCSSSASETVSGDTESDSITVQGAVADSTASLTVLFTGDVLLDRGVRPIAERKGVEYLFEEVSPVFREADAVVVNLECPLTDRSAPINKKYIFRAESRWAKDLRNVGITHAAMANNHTNDQGREGLADTYRNLLDADIVPLGYGLDINEQLAPAIIEKQGIRVAVFNATTLGIENWCRLEGKPGISQPSTDELTEAVSTFKSAHRDTKVVVVLHWGIEFQTTPSIKQRALARNLVDAGADAIIGHHPHVLQPVSTIDGIPVFFSIGNFVFDQHPPQARKSMIARLRFTGDGNIAADSISVDIRNNRPCIQY